MADLSFWNADYTAAGNADRLLRQCLEWAKAESGHVDAPTGWFGIIEITPDIIAKYASENGDPWVTERRNFEPGVYAVVEDTYGNVYGMYYHDDLEQAEKDFDAANEVYAAWPQD